MLPKSRKRGMGKRRRPSFAGLFATLGDETRLALVATLASGEPRSIAELTAGSKLTRQAITKHLRVLEGAGMVRCARAGRESLYELSPEPIDEIREYLDFVAQKWDHALERLKRFVED